MTYRKDLALPAELNVVQNPKNKALFNVSDPFPKICFGKGTFSTVSTTCVRRSVELLMFDNWE